MSLFLYQVLVILFLFITGMIFVNSITDKKLDVFVVSTVSLPAGLAMFGVTGLILLIFGIRYSLLSIGVAYVLIFSLLIYRYVKCGSKTDTADVKKYVAVTAVAAVVAAVCVSGLIPVGISNDSIYYYSLYPQTMVIDGGLSLSYDVFLTDVGQSVAVINTIPFLFGFNETYGIQLSMMVSFYCFFVYFINGRIAQRLSVPRVAEQKGISGYIAKNTNLCIKLGTIFCALFLMVCTPFLTMSEWILANAYFMEYMFMIFAITYIINREHNNSLFCVVTLFVAFLSMMRMEGGLMAGLLILCLCMYEISNSRLIIHYVVPAIALIIPYYMVLYIKFKVNPLYSFLSIKNAALQVGFLLAVGIYIGFFRGKKRFDFINNNFAILLITAFLLGNASLCLYKPEKYQENITAFFKNVILGNGWGYFGFFVLLILILLSAKKSLNANSLFCITYILLCIATLFARDGALRVGTGDSGNRVLLQIVPFVIYTLFDEIVGELIDEKQ